MHVLFCARVFPNIHHQTKDCRLHIIIYYLGSAPFKQMTRAKSLSALCPFQGASSILPLLMGGPFGYPGQNQAGREIFWFMESVEAFHFLALGTGSATTELFLCLFSTQQNNTFLLASTLSQDENQSLLHLKNELHFHFSPIYKIVRSWHANTLVCMCSQP